MTGQPRPRRKQVLADTPEHRRWGRWAALARERRERYEAIVVARYGRTDDAA